MDMFCNDSSVCLTVLSTQTKGSEGKVPETRVSLVKKEKLKETLDSLDKVFSQHVYRWLVHLKCQTLGLEIDV